MDELKALSYFSSLNHISKNIAQPEILLVKHLGNKWSDYLPEQQEELFDDLCVPHSARFDPVADDSGLPSCWPTLKLPSGEKIIVDENDIWTWRDEHSGPFSWKSKSQQDLTLLDIEAENLTKPHGKGHKSSSESEPASPLPPASRAQFSPRHGSWTQAVLEDFVANCQEEIESASEAPTAPCSIVESPSEEVNPAFEGSVEDLSPSEANVAVEVSHPPPQQTQNSKEATPDNNTPVHPQAAVVQEDGNVTPPPKKLSHPIIGKKEGKGPGGKLAIDSSQQLLIIHNKEEERSAFTNPAMEVEWSNFVGQSTTDPVDEEDSVQTDNQVEKARPSHPPPPVPFQLNEPPPAMVMDRGLGLPGEESTESTPDHTTQLLKPVAEAGAQEEAEKEEVVYVVDEGSGPFSVSSKLVAAPQDKRSSVPISGFDFLDNW